MKILLYFLTASILLCFSNVANAQNCKEYQTMLGEQLDISNNQFSMSGNLFVLKGDMNNGYGFSNCGVIDTSPCNGIKLEIYNPNSQSIGRIKVTGASTGQIYEEYVNIGARSTEDIYLNLSSMSLSKDKSFSLKVYGKNTTFCAEHYSSTEKIRRKLGL